MGQYGIPMAAGYQVQTSCSTLFVANVSPYLNETQLKELFGKYPGFVNIRIQRPQGVAFVKYQSQDNAFAAMNALQNVSPSNDSHAFRIEFARSDMSNVVA
eukprot:TRINITY_DN959_c0_g1_i4.p2 TRINITY_DN959_c0_g1~~TRINITY_DN959_c0_g1_i4.p2  ORF type:complete len:101 (+),score=20.64 TRINITY_DN959_c0_g1_i4:243-545(+)